MTITVPFPTGFASLSDGTTTIPFIFTDGQGKKNPLSFRTDPYPRTALKTTTGESKYSDLEPPFFAIPQDDFTGGRGNEDFENDTSRYFDGHWLDTSKEGGVVLGGRETYSTGYKNADFVMPGSMLFKSLFTTESWDEYYATTFEASASYTTYQCEIWLKRTGTPASIKVELWSDSGGTEPNAMLCTKTLTPAEVTSDTLGVSVLRAFIWTGAGSNEDIVDGTDYWVVVIADGSDNSLNYWQLGTQSGVTGKRSIDDGSTWGSGGASSAPYFRITPVAANFIGKFFEYKRGLYMVTQPDSGGNSALYINGDRGTADDNSGDKTNLEDATKSAVWTADEWIGNIVLITKGPGSEETQNWRTITDNDTTSLQVSPDWNVTHTISTEYVILGSDKWTNLSITFSSYVTDVAVTGEFIYFAKGAVSLHRVRFFTNSSGVWTTTASSDTPHADSLLAIYSSDEGSVLYGAENDDDVFGVNVWKAKPHDGAYALYYSLGELVESDKPWDSIDVDNVTQGTTATHTSIAVASGHSTGIVAVKNLPTPLDITHANFISMWIKTTASGGVNDLKFLYDDVEDLGQTWSPDKVLLEENAHTWNPTKVQQWPDFTSATSFTDLPRIYDGLASTEQALTIDNGDLLCVGYSEKFNKITVDLDTGGTVNAVADCTLTAEYFNGSVWTNVAITDGTKVTDNGTFRTFAQDGVISFTIPDPWEPFTLNSVEAYWVYLYFVTTPTPAIEVRGITVTNDMTTGQTKTYRDLTEVYAGTAATRETIGNIQTEDYLYVGNGTKFNKITFDFETVATEDGAATAAYWNGSAWTSVTITTDGTAVSTNTFHQDGTMVFTIPNDWEANFVNGTETYWIRLDVSVALDTAFSINEITVTRQNNITLSIPTLTQNVWTWFSMAFSSPTAYPLPDSTTIKSIGIKVTTDDGAQTISIHDVRIGVGPPDDYADGIARLPSSHRINGMEAYSGNVDDPVENPWIFTEKGVYELQTQTGQMVAIPLKELSTLQSSENGLGHTVNGTYLYFNIGEKIERYFNRTLDDIGPDRDEGLPDDRPGIPKSLVSYPGRVYAGIDAGTSGTSSVLALDGSAWHEVYRTPDTNLRIRSIYIQAIPGTNVDRLWISMGSDILWLPISLNPYNETDYAFTHEGQLVTSWIYAGMQDVVKTWKSLKLFQEIDANRYIAVDYMVDVDTTWTKLSAFTQAPVQERDIASPLPQSKRIKFRLRFISFDESITPRLKAMVTEGVAFVPVKTKYSWTFVISKDSQNIDLKGKWNSDLTSLQKRDQLLTWANAGTPLTMRHYSAVYDNKTVWVDPASVAPLRIVAHEDIENHVTQLSCFDY